MLSLVISLLILPSFCFTTITTRSLHRIQETALTHPPIAITTTNIISQSGEIHPSQSHQTNYQPHSHYHPHFPLYYTNHNHEHNHVIDASASASTSASTPNTDSNNSDTANKIAEINAIPLSLNRQQIMSLPSNERYQYRIKQLLHHNQTHGTLDIPYNYPHDPQLAKWVITQRYEYRLLTMEKIGVKSYLTKERLEMLDYINFPWDREDMYANGNGDGQEGLTKRWMAKWELLKAYQKEYYHSNTSTHKKYRHEHGYGHGHGHDYKQYEYRHAYRYRENDLGHDQNRNLNHGHTLSHTMDVRSIDVDIPESCIYRGAKLGVWFNNQRKSAWTQPDDIKTKVRIKKLKELGFVFNTKEDAKRKYTLYNILWMERYEELKEFYRLNGHFYVPSQSQSESESELSIWVRSQRVLYRQYRENKKNGHGTENGLGTRHKGGTVSCNECNVKDRIELMNDIGFDWDGRKSMEFRRNETWWETFEEFKLLRGCYKNVNMDLRQVVPVAKKHDIGIDYRKCSSAEDVDIDVGINIIKLDHWFKTQRSQYKRYMVTDRYNGTLSDDKISALTNLGFVWDLHGERWQNKFEELKAFGNLYGHFNVPTAKPRRDAIVSAYEQQATHMYNDDVFDGDEFWKHLIQLGTWAMRQRTALRKYKRGEDLDMKKTTRFRMALLDEMGILVLPESADDSISAARGSSSEEKNEVWDRHFAALEKFQAEHGHCCVPSDDDDPKLHVLHDWVSLQKRRFRVILNNIVRNKYVADIELERLDKLKALGFVWNLNDYKFQSGLNRLQEYSKKHGHMKVPPNCKEHPHLYAFVRKQRELYRARVLKGATNSLTDERIKKLDMLGFIWCPRGCSID